MEATYKTLGGKLIVKIDFANTKELLENLSSIQDVCEQDTCGHCGGDDLKFVVRAVGDDKYYEVQCKDPKCLYKLGFGIPKKGAGNLYPRRKNNKTKEPIGPKKDGWHYFKNNEDDDEE